MRMQKIVIQHYLPGIFVLLLLLLFSCGGSSSQRWIERSDSRELLHRVDSPVYGNFRLLSGEDYQRFYQRTEYYTQFMEASGARPVAIMMHGCAGLGEFYESEPFRVEPDSAGNYAYAGGVSTYLNTYANYFVDMGVLPYIIDSNGPRSESLVQDGELVISCYDTLESRHAAYIATRLEDVRRAILYLWYRAQQAESGERTPDGYPDLHNIYIVGWSQGAETILRFTMDVDYRDGVGVLHTMEPPFTRLRDAGDEIPEVPLNLIGIYPAAGHLLSREAYLKTGKTINTAIFTGSADEFYQEVRAFQSVLQRLPGEHLYREFEEMPHSFDKDRDDPEMIRATNETRRTIRSFIRLTVSESK